MEKDSRWANSTSQTREPDSAAREGDWSSPSNAVLSYTYVLLTALLTSEIQISGLDVYCGLVHRANRNAPALALDLVEQFRQPLADRFVMYLFNKRILQAKDFIPTERYPVALEDKARKRLLEHWERFLSTPQKLLGAGDELDPRTLIRRQVGEFKKAVRDERPYRNFRLC